MEVGALYVWVVYANNALTKYHGRECLYLGEDIINRPDGVTIVNHRIMMVGDGTESLLDRTCLKYLQKK
jgi:hypothetical protein